MAQKKSSAASGGGKGAAPKTTSSAPPAKRAPAAKAGVSSRSAGAKRSAPPAKKPHRREVAAGICLILGIFSIIGYFESDAMFIRFFSGFAKNFIGYGYIALPPALIMCAVILAFHKGYPVMLRTISTLSLAALTGALAHVFAVPFGKKYDISFAMFRDLWVDGAKLESGGIISGSVAEIFIVLFSGIGTVITFIIVAAILTLIAFNATLSGVLSALRGRERLEYEVQPEPDEDGMEPSAEAIAQSRQRQYRFPLIPRRKKKKIDIPLDENAPPKKDHFADDPAPDASEPKTEPLSAEAAAASARIIDNITADDKIPVVAADDLPRQVEDLPLDIPFMDGRVKRKPRPPVVPLIEEVEFMGTSKPAPAQDAEPLIEKPPYTRNKKRPLPFVPLPEGPGAAVDTLTEAANSTGGANTMTETVSGTSGIGNASSISDAYDSAGSASGYKKPPLDLLEPGDPHSKAGDGEVKLNSERLEAAFQSFGINVNITNTTCGPSVTRYEAELEAGIKLSRLTGLSDDIALALGTLGVRIAAMPNKISTVGIEVPNKNISKVNLRDVIESKEFQQSPSKLAFAIGMDISGEAIVGDISKLPHILIAGTTGSGKSVCLNSIILSLLYKSTPDDVRMVMIDPKLVEFRVYGEIPHLHVPLVTDPKNAAGALQTAVAQMMKRYNMFAEANARDIASYNKIAAKSEEMNVIPHLVIIIDELADLMLTAAKEVEEAICRIAQMGRASGIHLVIATQSPRANVITGLMKANIPSRIAFKVASALESQIILDPGQNADKLVGNGDMLYAPIGAAKPMRLQGTWVSDKERERVVEHIKTIAQASYNDEFMHEMEKAAVEKSSSASASSSANSAGAESQRDELLVQAVDVIFETGQASVSMLQRRLGLGYARAARIVDQMEEMGIIGQFEGSKPRALLITRDQWRQMQYIDGTAPTDKPDL